MIVKLFILFMLFAISLGVTFIIWEATIGSTRKDGSHWLTDIVDEIKRRINDN